MATPGLSNDIERHPFSGTISPDSEDTLTRRIVYLWTVEYLSRPAVAITLVALFIAYFAFLSLLGPVPSTSFGNDVMIYLDGGWRILNGLVPHHDFYLALGPVTYMCVAAGLWIAHNSAMGVSAGFLLFGAFITVLAVVAARTRMTDTGSLFYSLFILLLCTGAAPLGSNPSTTLSYAMIYNRFGYGLLSVIFIVLLLPPRNHSSNRARWWAGFAAGLSLALLFFLKITYFGAGAGLLALSLLVDLKVYRRALAIGAGLLFGMLGMLALLRFHVAAIAGDLIKTLHARTGGAIPHFGLTDVLDLSTTSLLALAAAVYFFAKSGSRRVSGLHVFGAAIYTILMDALLSRTNAIQGSIYPLYVIFVFILLGHITEVDERQAESRGQFAASLIVIGLSLTLPMFYTHVRSLALLASYKTSPQLKAAAFHVEGAQLQNLAFYDFEADQLIGLENGRYYTGYLNDGIELLKKHSRSSDIVASLSVHNPFSYALLRKPPHAGSTWLLMDNNISATHMLSDGQMFGDATVVMVPKYRLNVHLPTDEFLFNHYKSYLQTNFTFVAESDLWRLYRRVSKP